MSIKILLADDDKDILDLISQIFVKRGYDVFKVSSGSEAIKFLEKKQVDFVVSDFKMTNGDGKSVLEFVNRMEIKPVFYFFSAENESMLNDFLQVGVKGIYSKPFHFDRLITDLENTAAQKTLSSYK